MKATSLDTEGNFVKVPVELWNQWMQEREDYRTECERLRLLLDKTATKLEKREREFYLLSTMEKAYNQ